jgi:hypothetical protein
MEKIEEIDAICERQKEDFLRRSSLTYLECCISLMLTHMSVEEVAAILERQAETLRELD